MVYDQRTDNSMRTTSYALILRKCNTNRNARKRTLGRVRPAKIQISLRIRAV